MCMSSAGDGDGGDDAGGGDLFCQASLIRYDKYGDCLLVPTLKNMMILVRCFYSPLVGKLDEFCVVFIELVFDRI